MNKLIKRILGVWLFGVLMVLANQCRSMSLPDSTFSWKLGPSFSADWAWVAVPWAGFGGPGDTNYIPNAPMLGGTMGLNVELKLRKFFVLETGVEFISRGGKIYIPSRDQQIMESIRYVQLPLIYKLKAVGETSSLMFSLGVKPAWAFVHKEQIVFGQDLKVFYFNEDFDNRLPLGRGMRGQVFAHIGMEWQQKLDEKWDFRLGVHFDRSLIRIYKTFPVVVAGNDGDYLDLAALAFQCGVLYTPKFGNRN